MLFDTVCFILAIGTGSNAYATVGGVVNNTKDSAVSLTYNTLDKAITFHPTVLYGCTLSGAGDEGWYKVSLPVGTQTLSINADKPLTAQVFSSDDIPVFEGTYGPSCKIGQKFEITQAGIYYIKATSVNSEDVSYYVMAGAPWYKAGSYTYNYSNFIPVSATTKISAISSFNLGSTSSIPDTAIVTQITATGTESGSAYGRVRSLKAYNQFSWINLQEYTFQNTNVYTSASPIMLKQSWQFKHSVSTLTTASYSLKPSILFKYMAEDNSTS